MRILQPPNFDLVVELTPWEWAELHLGLEEDLLLRPSENNIIARVGGAWVLIILKEERK